MRITGTVPGSGSALSDSSDVIPIWPGRQDVEVTIASGKSFPSPIFRGSGSKLDKENHVDNSLKKKEQNLRLTKAQMTRINFIVLIVQRPSID